MSLPLRQRVLAAAAFVTALGLGYVAGLDETGHAAGVDSTAGLLPTAARSAAAGSPGVAGGRSSARGDWPEPGPDASRAWGQEIPVRSDGGVEPPLATKAAAAAAARAKVPARPAAPEASATGAEAPPPPAWRLIGRVDDGGTPRALLSTPQQLLVVAGGDVLDGRWRVERIGAEAVELRALAGEHALRLAWEVR